MKRVMIENGSQIPENFGTLRTAVRKTTVRIREVRPEGETFEKSWGVLTARRSEDLVIIQDGGSTRSSGISSRQPTRR